MARKSNRTARSSSAVVPPVIYDPIPQTFVDGDTYNVGAPLANFAPNSISSAFFAQGEPRASFSNTNTPTILPSPSIPQQVLFLNSKFSYTGTTPTTAFLTVTVITRGTPVSKTVKVNYLPRP